MRKKGFGIRLTSPISNTHIRFAGYSFVDDTDLLKVISTLQQYGYAILSIQQAVDTWEAGLKVTGGALVPEKTFWYLLDFEWKGGDWSYRTIQSAPGRIHANDITGRQIELRQVEPYTAEETLGIFLAPTGDTSWQKEKMRKLSLQWSLDMKQGRLTKNEAWLSLTSTLWRSLDYPLPALNLTKDQCEHIMALAIEYALNAMGFCRHFPRVLVFAPERYFGQVFHIYTRYKKFTGSLI